jgi:hypothetical protein
MKLICALLLSSVAACSTLGPTAVATGVSPIPRGRFDGELQLGAMPGYYLSSGTVKNPQGSPLLQLSAIIEPGAAVPGLIVGGRLVGQNQDTATDPMIGYRQSFGPDRRMSVSIVGFGDKKSATRKSADYTATHLGAEVAGDLRLGRQRPWIEPHLELALSLEGIWAHGDYCADQNAYGVDCPDPPALPILHHADASGAYPAATVGATLLVAHHHESWVHGVRAMILLGAGLMPRVVDYDQVGAQPYVSGGFALSISVGAPR